MCLCVYLKPEGKIALMAQKILSDTINVFTDKYKIELRTTHCDSFRILSKNLPDLLQTKHVVCVFNNKQWNTARSLQNTSKEN